MTTTIPLKKPIQAHGETISEIELREPTGKDIRLIGVAFSVHPESGTVTFNSSAIANYIAALGSIPLSSVDSLSVPDFNAAMAGVMGFFGE